VADQYGAEPIPLVAPAAGFAAGDRALTYLLQYFTAFLNVKAVAAWQAAGIAPNVPVVRKSFAHDPKKVSFSTADLPALYMWRSGSEKPPEQYADDYRLTHDVLELLWVLPTINQETDRKREPIDNAIKNLIDVALEEGRDPSWIVAGDPDPAAATRGSLIWNFATFYEMSLSKWKASTFQPDARNESGGVAGIFHHHALSVTFEIQEVYSQDLANFDPLQGMDTTYQTADSPPLVIETGRNT
jgi:hypothetical protein